MQPYAFTTKSLYVGHMDYRYLRWQVRAVFGEDAAGGRWRRGLVMVCAHGMSLVTRLALMAGGGWRLARLWRGEEDGVGRDGGRARGGAMFEAIFPGSLSEPSIARRLVIPHVVLQTTGVLSLSERAKSRSDVCEFARACTGVSLPFATAPPGG